MTIGVSCSTGLTDNPSFQEALDSLVRDQVASRIFGRDATLWGEAAEAEASIRLGWTDVEPAARELIPAIEALRADFAAKGIDRIVLCGMGGSSLAPAVIARRSGVELTMLDSTHPAAVQRALSGELSRTAVVVSSKSGSTIETRSHLATFEHAFREAGLAISDRVVIVTDPGSPLDQESRAAGRIVFNADPEVGGRFSALTAFGLVPSGLAGVDIAALLAEAVEVRAALAQDTEENPALLLAAAIAAGLPHRYILAARSSATADWALGAWIEQLIAESTGKDSRGVLPIALQATAPEFSAQAPANVLPVLLSSDAAVQVEGSGPALAVGGTLGAHFLLWETATSALGRLMGIDPFNQPDVESAKIAAREALANAAASAHGADETPLKSGEELVRELRAALPENGYVAIHAFLDPGAEYSYELRHLRDRLAAALEAPVALGWGPSYLHSTGQLHKGGPATGVYLQFTDANPGSLAIPGFDSTFGELIASQARGDHAVLVERGRPVFTIACDDPATDLSTLAHGVK